jgi:hypothetical protein
LIRLIRTYPLLVCCALTGIGAVALAVTGMHAHLTETAATAATDGATALAVISAMCLLLRYADRRAARIVHTAMAVHELERKQLQEEREELQRERREMLLTLSKALGTGPIPVQSQAARVLSFSPRLRGGGDSA